jgi:UDP-N-acetylmuramate dehydrogenase
MRIMSLLSKLSEIVPEAGNRLVADVPMSKYSTFRIGGPADVFFEPANSDEIAKSVRFCLDEGIALTILGNGSNILVSDLGIRGVVLSIGEYFSGIERHQDLLLVKAGTRLSAIAAFAAQNGLAGLEFAAGIPGTLGGAILMNAGAYDHCLSEVVVLTEYFDETLSLKSIVRKEHQFLYRKSYFTEHKSIILRACLQLIPDDPQFILARMADLASRRQASQPLELPSAGSAFKRPTGHYAGKLISDCGLKGCRINAQVSEKHAGFIVNLGEASANDTRMLFSRIQKSVFEKTGVILESEVKFIGDWCDWEEHCHQDKG